MFLLKLLVLGVLGLLFIQDLKTRSVHWILFPVLAVVFIAIRVSEQPLKDIIYSIAISLIFLFVQLIILTLYFSVKQKRLVNLTDELLGLGDIIFLITLALYLSPVNYIFFYVLSLFLIVFGWMIWLQISLLKDQHIPFAGLQAFIFGGIFLFVWIVPEYNLFNDSKFIQLISK